MSFRSFPAQREAGEVKDTPFADARLVEDIADGSLLVDRYGTVCFIGAAYTRLAPCLVYVLHIA